MSSAFETPPDSKAGKFAGHYWPVLSVIVAAGVLLAMGRMLYRPFDPSLPSPGRYDYADAAFALSILLLVPIAWMLSSNRWLQRRPGLRFLAMLALLAVPMVARLFGRAGPEPVIQQFSLYLVIFGAAVVLGPVIRPLVRMLAGIEVRKRPRTRPWE